MKVTVAGLIVVAATVVACQGTSGRRPAPPDLERRWRLYQLGDPGWPAARNEWLALGGHEAEILILNLLAEMESGTGDAWLRPLAELEAIGTPVVPYALAALQARRQDAVGRHRSRELLGRVADAATLETAYGQASEDDGLRVEIVAAIARCPEPTCADLLATVLTKDSSWEARARAAEGLADRDLSPDSRGARSVIAALGDADLFVARKAAATAAARQLTAAARPLLALLERARKARDERTATTVFDGLRTLTHHPEIGDDPVAWKALLERR